VVELVALVELEQLLVGLELLLVGLGQLLVELVLLLVVRNRVVLAGRVVLGHTQLAELAELGLL
jgi:hypothetical protein